MNINQHVFCMELKCSSLTHKNWQERFLFLHDASSWDLFTYLTLIILEEVKEYVYNIWTVCITNSVKINKYIFLVFNIGVGVSLHKLFWGMPLQHHKKVPVFYGTWRFSTMFRTACHWTLSLNQINPVSILIPYFFEIQFNIILLFTVPRSPKWSFPFRYFG
jgi:hypothetical protein